MELHAVTRQLAVLGAHDQPVFGPRGELERRGQRSLDDQGVVSTCFERHRDARKDASPLVEHERRLAVDGLGAVHGPT